MPTSSVWFGSEKWRLVRFISVLLVEVTQSAQGLVAGALGGGRAHDDVVAQFHFQKLAGADEIAGYFDVRLARRRVPRWVTVHGRALLHQGFGPSGIGTQAGGAAD